MHRPNLIKCSPLQCSDASDQHRDQQTKTTTEPTASKADNVSAHMHDVKLKYKDIAVHSLTCQTAMGTHMPYRITQCYLPPGRGDIPAFTPAEAGT